MWSGIVDKVLIAVAIGFAAFLYGFSVGIKHEDAKIAVAQAKVSQIKEAQTAALAKTINETQDTFNDANTTLLNANALLISKLSNRPARNVIVSAPAPVSGQCTTVAATGADLSRQDAEFLTGEATDTGKLANALTACYSREDKLRATMSGQSP